MNLGDAAMRLRGSEGSTVRLTIERDDSKFPVVLTRKKIKPVPAVQSKLKTTWEGRQIGYISVCISSQHHPLS
jgi:C-terminal processing protease CtpA/Prc